MPVIGDRHQSARYARRGWVAWIHAKPTATDMAVGVAALGIIKPIQNVRIQTVIVREANPFLITIRISEGAQKGESANRNIRRTIYRQEGSLVIAITSALGRHARIVDRWIAGC